MDNEVQCITKPKFFPPREHSAMSFLQEVELSQELKVIISDSDPYDALTYFLQGKPVATEFVASYEKRLQEVKTDIAGFCDALKEYSRRNGG